MEMKRKEQHRISPEILKGIDLSNSLHGGSSELTGWMKGGDEGYEFMVRVPGVDVEKLNVEVINDQIVVYYMFPIFDQEQPNSELYTRIVGKFNIPRDANYEEVSAMYMEDSRCLKVTMPFDEQQKGYRSKVAIDR